MEADAIRENLIEKVTLELALKFIIITGRSVLSPTSAEFTFILSIMTAHRHEVH